MVPNLFIVGAPKTGTTSLYHYLSNHPDVFMSKPKEINYFSKNELEKRDIYYRNLKLNSITEYEHLFKQATGKKVIGEASVSYLFYPNIPEKIFKYNPKSKILILLRNPIDRSISHYLMNLRLGFVNVPFENIITRSTEIKNINTYYQEFVELGLYYNQVKRYIDTFGEDKVKIILSEDLISDIKKTLVDTFTFLEISNSNVPISSKKYNIFNEPKNKILKKIYTFNILRTAISSILSDTKKESLKKILFTNKNKSEFSKEVKDFLFNIYKPDIVKLESLIARDLSYWYIKKNG